jgi:cell division protein FtsQ
MANRKGIEFTMWQDIKMLNGTANALLGLLAIGLFASCIWWLAQRPMFTLKAIRVEGRQDAPLRHISASTIRSTALPRVKGNFFTANLDSVRTAFESLPWVRRATVRREWPNRLIVTIEEHVPLGTWGEEGRLVSSNGDLFTANLAEAEDEGSLPEFGGPPGSEKEVVARYRDLEQWLSPVNLAPDAVQLSSRYAWTVKLSNGMTVELGREQTKDMLKARVERLVAIYPQLVARLQDRIESVDMRYPNGLALKASGMTFDSNLKKK